METKIKYECQDCGKISEEYKLLILTFRNSKDESREVKKCLYCRGKVIPIKESL